MTNLILDQYIPKSLLGSRIFQVSLADDLVNNVGVGGRIYQVWVGFR